MARHGDRSGRSVRVRFAPGRAFHRCEQGAGHARTRSPRFTPAISPHRASARTLVFRRIAPGERDAPVFPSLSARPRLIKARQWRSDPTPIQGAPSLGMRFEKLRLTGFTSFVEPTDFVIPRPDPRGRSERGPQVQSRRGPASGQGREPLKQMRARDLARRRSAPSALAIQPRVTAGEIGDGGPVECRPSLSDQSQKAVAQEARQRQRDRQGFSG